MSPRLWMIAGALLGGFAVAAGAFGAHSLEDPDVQSRLGLDAADLDRFETASKYLMYHALGLLATGVAGANSFRRAWSNTAGVLLLLGALIFCGMLYAYVFTGVKTFAMIVPIGGVSMILGWFVLAVAAKDLHVYRPSEAEDHSAMLD